MATVDTIIKRALVLINVNDAGEAPSADDSSNGLDALNDMLHGWKKEGIDLNHKTASLGDTLLVDASYLEGIRYNLAVRLAPEYGRPIPTHVAERATNTFLAFQAHTLEFDDDLEVDRALNPRYFSRRTGAYDVAEG